MFELFQVKDIMSLIIKYMLEINELDIISKEKVHLKYWASFLLQPPIYKTRDVLKIYTYIFFLW